MEVITQPTIEQLETAISEKVDACVIIERDTMKVFDLHQRRRIGRVTEDKEGFTAKIDFAK